MKDKALTALAGASLALGLVVVLQLPWLPMRPSERHIATLRWHGYTNPVLLPGRLNLPCDGNRRPQRRFTATDADGQPIRGYLCCSPRVGCEVEVVP